MRVVALSSVREIETMSSVNNLSELKVGTMFLPALFIMLVYVSVVTSHVIVDAMLLCCPSPQYPQPWPLTLRLTLRLSHVRAISRGCHGN